MQPSLARKLTLATPIRVHSLSTVVCLGLISMIYSEYMTEVYKITEQDIEGTMKYLQIFHPKHATKDDAIELLEYMKVTVHRLAVTDPEALEELYQALKKSKKAKN